MKPSSIMAALAAFLFLAALANPAEASSKRHHHYRHSAHHHGARVHVASVKPTERCSLDNNGRTICAHGQQAGGTYRRTSLAGGGTHSGRRVDRVRPDANGSAARGVVTVPTAAGIDITGSHAFAPKIVSFIAANVAAGRHFKQIHCLNFAKTHVPNSRHFSGDACDFQPPPIGRLAAEYGLRDGCSFHDCMHIDNGPAVSGRYYAARRHHTRMAQRR